MKKLILLTLVVAVLAGCSAPRTAYYFDTYDYNAGKKSTFVADEQPLKLESSILSADASTEPVILPPSDNRSSEPVAAPQKKYSDMSKTERKEFRQEVKKELKKYVKAVKKGEGVQAVKATSVMDNDLKLAIIFGAVGLTLSLFGGINEAFWILGVISIVVGVVFLIKWLVRQ